MGARHDSRPWLGYAAAFLLGILAAAVFNMRPTPTQSTSINLSNGKDRPAADDDSDRFCPWSSRYSTFRQANHTIEFGHGQKICLDTIIYGYDVLFQRRRLFGQTKWLGVPMQQDPLDLHVLQEIMWRTKPDVVIELGTNTGGGAVTLASLLALMGLPGRVITIDPNDYRQPWFPGTKCSEDDPCLLADENKHWKDRVTFIQGIPTDPEVLDRVEGLLKEWGAKTVMISEDSNHFYETVLDNTRAYSRFVTPGSYLLVQDTKMTRFEKVARCMNTTSDAELDECWHSVRLGPLDAVAQFLEEQGDKFVVDRDVEFLFYSQHAGGFLRRVK